MSTRVRTCLALLLPLLLTVGLTACGSDEDGGDGASGATRTTAVAPTGEPIKIMQWSPSAAMGVGTELYDAARAAVDEINAEGGIATAAGGAKRPLKLLQCTIDLGDAGPQSQRCAREAIENEVVAITGKYPGSDDAVKAVTAAGIPVVDAFAVSGGQDVTNELSFPLSGGGTTLAVSLGAALQGAGAQKVVLALADSPSARAFPPLATKLLDAEKDLLPTVYFPLDPSADVAPFAAQIANSKPDGVAIVHSPDGTLRMIRALRDAGFSGKIAVAGFNLQAAQIKSLGEVAEGIIVVSNWGAATSKGDDGIDRFNDAMDAHAPKAERSEFAIASWVSVRAIAKALTTAESVDAAGVAAALDGLEVDDGGVPAFMLGTGGLKLVPLARVPRDTVQFQQVEDGKVVPLEDGKVFHLDAPKG